MTIVLAIGLLLGSATTALADEYICRGTVGARTLDNVRVPDGSTCTLNGTTVKGTVKVETGATLVASEVRVVGNVQAENAAKVVVRDSRVGGSVQVKQGKAADIRRNRVNADIQSTRIAASSPRSTTPSAATCRPSPTAVAS